jgi:hypothetical protein
MEKGSEVVRFERGRFGWWKEIKPSFIVYHYTFGSTQISSLGTNPLEFKALEFKTQLPKKPILFDFSFCQIKDFTSSKDHFTALESIHQLRCNKTKPIILLGFVKTHPSSFTEWYF